MNGKSDPEPVAADPRMAAAQPSTRIDIRTHRRFPNRLLALDVFRGITVAGMLLVNDPGSWEHIYPPLEHAPWNGWTPTDLIFPFFLFIVGITTEISLGKRRSSGQSKRDIVVQILRRGFLIFLFGFLLNAFPFYTRGTIDGVVHPTVLARVAAHFADVRIMGVLQRIGIVYAIAALITLRFRPLQYLWIVGALLIGYWAAMTLIPVPGTGMMGISLLDNPEQTLSAWIDRGVLGADHLWTGSWDPEGLLSTIPAIATALVGAVAGRWILSRRPIGDRVIGLYGAGSIAAVIGLMWNWLFPINKNLWSSSFVVFTAGMACLTLATCLWIVDIHRITKWSKPFAIFGINPLVAFVGSGLMARITDSMIRTHVHGERTSLHMWVYYTWLNSWLPDRAASLAYAIAFVVLWLLILLPLHRKKLIVKI